MLNSYIVYLKSIFKSFIFLKLAENHIKMFLFLETHLEEIL